MMGPRIEVWLRPRDVSCFPSFFASTSQMSQVPSRSRREMSVLENFTAFRPHNVTFKDWLPHQCRVPRGRFTSDDKFFKNKKIFWRLLSWSVVIVAYSFYLRFSAACDPVMEDTQLLYCCSFCLQMACCSHCSAQTCPLRYPNFKNLTGGHLTIRMLSGMQM